eukprot:CAMPEP_0184200570 /NCGR_PEP_ID=MMETSP0976-20121227/7599_1 /TAXON_ID=483370 /ORGANISM="non described non described, Strain CCMP2097" /LENGTH=242 /DNA_ID=CAMNT_0026505081 /DNA_START=1 /DNA_END=725 /DNA_ORIENTATION=+
MEAAVLRAARRRRAAPAAPFASDLTRCRRCQRSKQGAIFCRISRSHRDDGWQPPKGFDAWMATTERTRRGPDAAAAAAEGSSAASHDEVEHATQPRRPREAQTRPVAQPGASSSASRSSSNGNNSKRRPAAADKAADKAAAEKAVAKAASDVCKGGSPAVADDDAFAPLRQAIEIRRAREVWVWRPTARLSDAEVSAYVDAVAQDFGLKEDDALALLYQADYDTAAALKGLGPPPRAPPPPP